jgi:putative flippase GtrA
MALDFSGLPKLWDVKGWLLAILSREKHPLLQFIRYGIAGVAAMVANLVFFVLCIRWVFISSDVVTSLPVEFTGLGNWLSDMRQDPRVGNYVKANAVAFVMSNVVAYVLNFKWVFESGRHSRHVEIFLFFSVSLFSFVIGTAVASILVGNFGVHDYIAKMSDVVFAILINFVCRKFLVFKK